MKTLSKSVPAFFGILLSFSFVTARATAAPSVNPEMMLKVLGITLPTPGTPKNHVEARLVGNLMYVSGQVSVGETPPAAKLRNDEKGQAAARSAAIAMISALRAELIRLRIGDLRRVKQIVKVTGFINIDEGADSAAILDGASNLLVQLFGEHGKSARTPVGMDSKGDFSVQVEMIAEIVL